MKSEPSGTKIGSDKKFRRWVDFWGANKHTRLGILQKLLVENEENIPGLLLFTLYRHYRIGVGLVIPSKQTREKWWLWMTFFFNVSMKIIEEVTFQIISFNFIFLRKELRGAMAERLRQLTLDREIGSSNPADSRFFAWWTQAWITLLLSIYVCV